MNHRHRKILHALFAHPVSANIPLEGVETMLGELGAEVEAGGHGRVHVRLDGRQLVLAHHGAELSPGEVQHLRKFLVDGGVDPATQYPV